MARSSNPRQLSSSDASARKATDAPHADLDQNQRHDLTVFSPVGWKFSACEEVADQCRDFLRMSLEREVASVEEMNGRTGNVASESLGTTRQEKGIVLSPCCQEGGLVLAEVFLERGIQRNITFVVAKQVQLDLISAGAGEIKIVERIAVWRNRGRVGNAVGVLPARCVRFQKSAYRITVGS